MKEMYGVMAGFALDFYIESNLTVKESEVVMEHIDNDIDNVMNTITAYIEEQISEDKEFVEMLSEYYNNNFLDYLAFFKLMDGQVESIDTEVKDFILLCNRLAESCVKDIVKNILYK